MIWMAGDTTLNAYCEPNQYCKIMVDDYEFLKAERSIQQQFKDAQQLKNAPTAPQL